MLCEKDAMSEKNVRKDLLFLRGLLSRLGPRYISLVNLPGVLAAIPTTALGVYYVTTTIPFTPQQVNILGIILGILIPPVAALGFLNFSRSSAGDPGCAGRAAGSACVARNRGQGLAGSDPLCPPGGCVYVLQSLSLPDCSRHYRVCDPGPSPTDLFALPALRQSDHHHLGQHLPLLLTEWALWPVRERLLPRSPEVQQRYMAGVGIQSRMLVVYTALILTTLLMVVTIAYRKSEEALAPGANPVLVLQSMQNHIVFVSLLGLFVSLGFSLLLSRSVAVPLRRLAGVMAEVGRGNLGLRGEVVSTDETGRLTVAFNQMVSQLQALQAGLEEQVARRTAELARRTAQLEAAATVAREAAEIRDLDTLLNETVRLISDRFGFYHAGIFLLDERGEYAVLQAASSEGGRRMLARGHRLAVGKVGIVGTVAGTGKPRIALDVGADAVFFDNPDLPLTRSEMALPLRVGERVIGVLDVQSEEPEAFTQEDVAVLQTLADQIALAVENARTLEQMQRTVRELERATGEYTREAWRTVQRARRWVGRRYRRLVAEPAEEPTEEARRALSEGRSVLQPLHEEGDGRVVGTRLAVPMKLRGRVIGVLNLRFAAPEVPPETVQMVEAIADRLTLALENARLLEETRRHAERDRMIAEITARVRASMDPETILRTALRELGAALGADRVMVRMMNPSHSEEVESGSRVVSGP
jgi:GAF domain-containing protein/HAMP domain-containing protein